MGFSLASKQYGPSGVERCRHVVWSFRSNVAGVALAITTGERKAGTCGVHFVKPKSGTVYVLSVFLV